MREALRGNESIRSYVESHGFELRVIGKGITGLPIFCVMAGGRKTPPIMITAGSHATEPGGVAGALKVIAEIQTEHALFVVPNRDPAGLEGYHHYLAFAMGKPVSFSDNRELKQHLKTIGAVVYEDEELTLALVGEMAFGAMEPSPEMRGPREVWLKVGRLLAENSQVRDKLRRKRVVTPTNLPHSDGGGLFERAYSTIVTEDGQLTNLNRQFGNPTAPQEVRDLQAFVDDVRPGLTLDMHEGHGRSFYLITPRLEEGSVLGRIARAIVAPIKKRGYRLYTLAELRERIGEEEASRMRDLGDGIIEEELEGSEMRSSLMGYVVTKYGPCYTFETGRDPSLDERGSFHAWAAEGAIRAFEALSM